jgi:transcription elongation factor GreA-like protein
MVHIRSLDTTAHVYFLLCEDVITHRETEKQLLEYGRHYGETHDRSLLSLWSSILEGEGGCFWSSERRVRFLEEVLAVGRLDCCVQCRSP